jgi:hypothetical protein
MKWKIEDLKKEIIGVLGGAGFPPEHYLIKTGIDHVAVFFDAKEAVDYFRVDFENSDIAKDCIYEYRKDGKRHTAFIHSW